MTRQCDIHSIPCGQTYKKSIRDEANCIYHRHYSILCFTHRRFHALAWPTRWPNHPDINFWKSKTLAWVRFSISQRSTFWDLTFSESEILKFRPLHYTWLDSSPGHLSLAKICLWKKTCQMYLFDTSDCWKSFGRILSTRICTHWQFAGRDVWFEIDCKKEAKNVNS